MEQAIQAERVGGFRDYIDDVKSGGFPGLEHVVKAPEGLIDQFLAKLDGTHFEAPNQTGNELVEQTSIGNDFVHLLRRR